MLFKDWIGPYRAAEAALEDARKSVGRRWEVPGPRFADAPNDRLEIMISAGYVDDAGVFRMHVSAYHGWYGNDVARYSARELRQLAAAKDYVARWTQGEIDDLPLGIPPEILALR